MMVIFMTIIGRLFMGAYSVAEAKAHLSEILKLVEAGKRISITKRGRPVATIVPAQPRQSINWAGIEAFRKTLPRSKTSAARLVREMRDAGF